MNILLPVDGSTHTKKMLSYLAAHDDPDPARPLITQRLSPC